ncbi:hypothetical protein [Streptomyces sp. NBC_01497]|uniref:hypothetical protein n=1 Tax=Streptomyces sp. NBC_01497 TaxID=2903885 RepID=UPI002E30368D|nr:hypothetical protein [Streptomyces sp. NBC_01497]
MRRELEGLQVEDGERVSVEQIPIAVTAGELIYDNGSVQTFAPDGSTRYIEAGRPTEGEWRVDEDGNFCSFWPPSYRASYDLRWIVEAGSVVGLRFSGVEGGTQFDGRYQ